MWVHSPPKDYIKYLMTLKDDYDDDFNYVPIQENNHPSYLQNEDQIYDIANDDFTQNQFDYLVNDFGNIQMTQNIPENQFSGALA